MKPDYKKIVEQCKEGRGNWESLWQEIATRCMTEQANFNTTPSKGESRTERVMDSTATTAINRSAAALSGLITPSGQQWHTLGTDDPVLNKDRSIREFFDEVTHILFRQRYNPKSGFATSNNQIYRSLMAFGTAPMFIEESPDGRGIRYQPMFLGKSFIGVDAYGRVDTFVREFELNKRQAMQEFGEATPEKIMNGPETTKHCILHITHPNNDYVIGSVSKKERKYKSVYVLQTDLDKPIKEDSYYEFPFPVARDIHAPNEIYGRSPAMHVLDEVKMLNAMRRTTIKAAHKIVSPPLLAPSQSVFSVGGLGGKTTINMRPDGITYGGVNQSGQQMIHPLQSGARPDVGLSVIEDSRKAINDAFLINLFQVLVETPSMTATEVLARTQERGILLAPIGDSLQAEYLGVMIERELGILQRQGMLPDLPEALKDAKGDYNIVYDSPLTRAQRSEEVNAINELTNYATAAAAYDPSIMDNIDFEYNLKTIAEVRGASTKSLRSEEDVAAMRKGREQQQQSQQLMEQAPALAGAARDLSEAQRNQGGM